MIEERHVDWMSILIEKDKERPEHVDYIFMCDVYGQDPRNAKHRMVIAQNRGLFRVHKEALEAELLRPMEGDEDRKRFTRAFAKVRNLHKESGAFPDKAHFACG